MRLCDDELVSRLRALFARYRLRLQRVDDEIVIPGSYWGEPEAGIMGNTLYVRSDTPLHSALHEAAHVVCMDSERRAQLHTNAGGDYAEENAVCYLQILLALELGVSANDICADMDTWGYTFRLGSAYSWFTRDAQDAGAWLLEHDLISIDETPTWRRRETARAA